MVYIFDSDASTAHPWSPGSSRLMVWSVSPLFGTLPGGAFPAILVSAQPPRCLRSSGSIPLASLRRIRCIVLRPETHFPDSILEECCGIPMTCAGGVEMNFVLLRLGE